RGQVAGCERELIPWLAVYLGIATEAHAAPTIADRLNATGASHTQTLGPIIVHEGTVIRILMVDEGELVAITVLPLPFVFRHLGPRAGAGARSDNGGIRLKLVGEVCANEPAGGGIIWPVLRTERTDLVVVGEGHIGAVLRVEGNLKQVCQAAVCPAAQPAGRDSPSVDDVVAGGELREHWSRVVTT